MTSGRTTPHNHTPTMKPQAFFAIAIVGFAGISAATTQIASYQTPEAVATPAIEAPQAVDPEKAAIEEMKKCASDALVARMRWFYDETGLTTTKYSGDAQRYANTMEAAGLQTKTPIPSPVC